MTVERQTQRQRRDVRDTPSRQFSMRSVDPTLVERMAQHLQCRKPGHVIAKLGISLNTWGKLLSGGPIRASVADRLVDRFSQHINA